jgi:hypothetical protein
VCSENLKNFASFKVARQPEYGTNRPYLIDFIEIHISAKLLNSEEVRDLYLKHRLSCAQIGQRFGVSRRVIAARLRDMGIGELPVVDRTNPENYRLYTPPYGYSVRDGKLATNKAELKICRLVVELIAHEQRSQMDVARELSRRGFKSRAGNRDWNSKTVFNIYKRWKDKL